MIKKYLAILILSSLTGWLFSIIHFPLPWTLGPLLTVVIVKLGFKQPVYWPMRIRNIAMVVLGFVMGSPFTTETGKNILAQLPAMSILTLLTVILSLSGGYIVGKYMNLHISTSLIGSMPGGLAQMAIACEDIDGSDAASVTLMQTVRVITTVFIVPFLVLHGLADNIDKISRTAVNFNIDKIPVLLLFAAVITGLIILGRRINIPSTYLLAPVLGTATLVLLGVNAPTLPSTVIAIAQICVGIRMGMAIELSSLGSWKKIVVLNFISVLSVIIIFLGIDYIFSRISGMPFVTAFICTAPGGINEMGLTAMMVHADLSTVIAFQLFRLLFVLLVAVPLIQWWLRRTKKECITYSSLD